MITVSDFAKGRSSRSSIGADWSLSIECFLNHCKAKNLRSRTVEWYEDILTNYFHRDFVAPNNIKSPETFQKSDVDRYIVYLHGINLKPSSINVRLRALRAFFNYLNEEDYISTRIKVKLVKTDKPIIKAFTEGQVRMLIESPKDIYSISFAHFRDWAIANFLIATGVRLATLLEVRVGDIDFVEHEIFLNHTKNREQYTIPLSFALSKVLSQYLKIRQGEPQDYLFCSSYGDPMGERTVQDRIKAYCNERLGENDQRCCCHDFRHTFAVMYIRNGGDLLTLQKLMGHKTLDMTRRYVNLLGEDVKTKFATCSPLDSVMSTQKTQRKSIRTTRR